VEWVRTVVAILPSWSGQSRASLQPIAELVGVSVPTPLAGGAPDRIAEGRAKGFGDFEIKHGVYAFIWRSSVFYFAYNEANNANLVGFHLRVPGPYESQKQASHSFFKTINPLLRNLDFGISRHIHTIREIIHG